MRKALFAVTVSLVLATTASAQDVKLLPWQEYWAGVGYTQSVGGEWDFTHNGRALNVHTLVGVPAGVLSIRNMWRVTENNSLTLYLVVLDAATAVRFDGHTTSLRLTFTCREASEDECRVILRDRLRRGTTVQSLGVANPEDYKDDKSNGVVVFSFHMNADGIYKVGAVEIPKF